LCDIPVTSWLGLGRDRLPPDRRARRFSRPDWLGPRRPRLAAAAGTVGRGGGIRTHVL